MRILLLTLLRSITALAATMSNADVVRMARRGASVREIVDKINQSESRFSLYPEDMKAMREQGVPEIVIHAMTARQAGDKLEVPATPASQAAGTISLRPAQESRPTSATTPTTIHAVAPGVPRLGADRRLYISPMEGQLDGFIAAEVIKEHLPVHIVLDDNDADLVLVGQSLKEDDHWYNAVWGGKDKNEGNLRLIDVRSGSMVWAGEAGDRSLIYGQFKRGGERKVAERLVRQMRKDYFPSK